MGSVKPGRCWHRPAGTEHGQHGHKAAVGALVGRLHVGKGREVYLV